MPHPIEELGIKLLMEHLKNAGHQVQRLHGTFDLEVDGKRAEVKSKTKCFDEIDFISLTQKQREAADKEEFDVYLVCNIYADAPEFRKVRSQALLSKQPRIAERV